MPFCLKIKLELSGSSGMWAAQGQRCVWRQLGRIAGFSGTPRQTGGRYCWSSSSPPTVMRRMQYRKMILRIAFIAVEQFPIYESKRLSPSFDDSPFLLGEDTADVLVAGPVLCNAYWHFEIVMEIYFITVILKAWMTWKIQKFSRMKINFFLTVKMCSRQLNSKNVKT